MNPILAGSLPLLATLGLTLTALFTVGVFFVVMVLRVAWGLYEPDDETGDED